MGAGGPTRHGDTAARSPSAHGRSARVAHDSAEPALRRGHRRDADAGRNEAADRAGRRGEDPKGRRAPRVGVSAWAPMTHTWGRTDTAGTWPRPTPAWTITTLLVALLSAVAIEAYRYAAIWTPLQRWSVSAYLRSQVIGGVGFTTTGHY